MSTLNFLHGIDVVEITDGPRPIRTLKSSVIALVGTAGKGPVNQPVLIVGSRRDAIAAFGAYTSDEFTIPRALDHIFKQGGATVVVVNVCDPEAHVSEESVTETLKLAGQKISTTRGFISEVGFGNNISAPYVVTTAGAVALPNGCTLVDVRHPTTNAVIQTNALVVGQRVTVNYTANLVATVDYTLNNETGEIKRTLSGSKLLPNATFSVTYDYVDPSLVTPTDVAGGYESDGTRTGIHAFANAQSQLGVHPRILVAPGFSHIRPSAAERSLVAVTLQELADRLEATAIVDCPNGTKEDAVAFREEYDSDRLYFIYPFIREARPGISGGIDDVPGSSLVAGLIAATDNSPDAGFWHSPSNRIVQGPLGLSKPIDFHISDPETVANYLNEHHVGVFIRENGFRLWGNRNAAGNFLSVRRTADMIQASVAEAHRWAVDQNITKGYVQTIVQSVNAYLNMLTRQGAILGGEAWADPEINTPASIQNGQLYIDFKFTPPYPAEHITFRAHLVNDYITNIFD